MQKSDKNEPHAILKVTNKLLLIEQHFYPEKRSSSDTEHTQTHSGVCTRLGEESICSLTGTVRAKLSASLLRSIRALIKSGQAEKEKHTRAPWMCCVTKTYAESQEEFKRKQLPHNSSIIMKHGCNGCSPSFQTLYLKINCKNTPLRAKSMQARIKVLDKDKQLLSVLYYFILYNVIISTEASLCKSHFTAGAG